jgi:hypothetical protein
VDWLQLQSERRAALEALVAVYADDGDDWIERVAYRATARHLEGPSHGLALGIWRAVGIEPRKRRRRGRPRKRAALK